MEIRTSIRIEIIATLIEDSGDWKIELPMKGYDTHYSNMAKDLTWTSFKIQHYNFSMQFIIIILYIFMVLFLALLCNIIFSKKT